MSAARLRGLGVWGRQRRGCVGWGCGGASGAGAWADGAGASAAGGPFRKDAKNVIHDSSARAFPGAGRFTPRSARRFPDS
ncbi:hypothetical protein [Pantoea sp. FN0307]|uniref:hypothetical protein n=1 Tax=Pantoea sp. FN0307 TaxID=3418560 RepID=UPI003CE7D327